MYFVGEENLQIKKERLFLFQIFNSRTMKMIKLFAVATMLLSCIGMNAQNTVYVQWNPIDAKTSEGSTSFNGFSAGYSKSFNLSSSIPFFIEIGGGVQYMWKKTTVEIEQGVTPQQVDAKIDMLSVKIPLNIGYAFHVPNTSITFLPFAGLVLRGNILGQFKVGDEEVNLFDEKEMQQLDNAVWQRMQFGWQTGLNIEFDRFLVGVSYGEDISKVAEDTKLRLKTVSVTAGFRF